MQLGQEPLSRVVYETTAPATTFVTSPQRRIVAPPTMWAVAVMSRAEKWGHPRSFIQGLAA